jgi:hypothetical protein
MARMAAEGDINETGTRNLLRKKWKIIMIFSLSLCWQMSLYLLEREQRAKSLHTL